MAELDSRILEKRQTFLRVKREMHLLLVHSPELLVYFEPCCEPCICFPSAPPRPSLDYAYLSRLRDCPEDETFERGKKDWQRLTVMGQ